MIRRRIKPLVEAKLHIGIGATRIVFLVGKLAIKLPRPDRWRNFLQGLLANLQERDFSTTGWPELCPIVWACPGGFVTPMRRARPLTEQEYHNFDWQTWAQNAQREGYAVPAEPKHSSYGWLDGRMVAVDYGN